MKRVTCPWSWKNNIWRYENVTRVRVELGFFENENEGLDVLGWVMVGLLKLGSVGKYVDYRILFLLWMQI
jgi:hypothetical protein